MKIKILPFGKIVDILSPQDWDATGAETAGALRRQLEAKFPDLKGMHYLLAVDKKITDEESQLQEWSTVALLPPFSGG